MSGRAWSLRPLHAEFDPGVVVIAFTVNGDDRPFLDGGQNFLGGTDQLEVAAINAFENRQAFGKLVEVKRAAIAFKERVGEVFAHDHQSVILEGYEGSRDAFLSGTNADEGPALGDHDIGVGFHFAQAFSRARWFVFAGGVVPISDLGFIGEIVPDEDAVIAPEGERAVLKRHKSAKPMLLFLVGCRWRLGRYDRRRRDAQQEQGDDAGHEVVGEDGAGYGFQFHEAFNWCFRLRDHCGADAALVWVTCSSAHRSQSG